MRLMEIQYDGRARFIKRPNRFLAVADILSDEGDVSIRDNVHVHDPGRLEEILIPGTELLLKRVENPKRKTKWDILAGRVEDQWVFIHSGYHRRISEAILLSDLNPFGSVNKLRAEVVVGDSRMDFLLEMEDSTDLTLEVKGCSLAVDGVALFPDAPTKRGTRHLRELIRIAESKKRSGLMFLAFRKDSDCFLPKGDTDPDFEDIFRRAQKAGVEIHVIKVCYNGKTMEYLGEIPICF